MSGTGDDVLESPLGRFTLRRHGHQGPEPLRAWDAADEFVLDEIHERDLTDGRWVVVDDRFGALAVALASTAAATVAWTDSHVTTIATAANLVRNGLAAGAVPIVPSTDVPVGRFDRAVVKVPRAKAQLDDLLRRLRPLLAPEAVVIGAGMTKAVHRSTIDSFERHLGPTPTTRARKKARLLLPAVERAVGSTADPSPERYEWSGPSGIVVTGMPNVFSATALDAGTRLLLDHVPDPGHGGTVVDLGCGTGVVGAVLADRHPGIHVVCCDESHQAIASARATVGRVTGSSTFHVTDVLDGVADRSADLVVVNPPFHAGGARTNAVADRMIVESRRVLRPGGVLRVVGNRHLPHHVTVKRVFGAVETVASDPQFVVLGARRPAG